jgi:hypothetical protein
MRRRAQEDNITEEASWELRDFWLDCRCVLNESENIKLLAVGATLGAENKHSGMKKAESCS